jgi:hypothetical protein
MPAHTTVSDFLRPDVALDGQITRGKTTRNRLRRVDMFLLLTNRALISARSGRFADAYYVDLGYGAEPFTTLESAQRLRTANPLLPVLGVEIEPERVQTALPYADDVTAFRLGGFTLPLRPGENVRIIRAFNVLRQYDEHEVLTAWQTMGRALLPGGLLIEGTSDPFGRVWVANLLRRTDSELVYEGLVFSTNFRWGFKPEMFQPVLPKNCIHRMLPGERINSFISAWKYAARETIAFSDWGLRQWFEASAHGLSQRGYAVHTQRRLLRSGYLWWKDSPGARVIQL